MAPRMMTTARLEEIRSTLEDCPHPREFRPILSLEKFDICLIGRRPAKFLKGEVVPGNFIQVTAICLATSQLMISMYSGLDPINIGLYFTREEVIGNRILEVMYSFAPRLFSDKEWDLREGIDVWDVIKRDGTIGFITIRQVQVQPLPIEQEGAETDTQITVDISDLSLDRMIFYGIDGNDSQIPQAVTTRDLFLVAVHNEAVDWEEDLLEM